MKKVTIEIEITPELLTKVREDNSLARDMDDAELTKYIQDFGQEVQDNLSMIMENMDYFNF